MWRVVYLQLNWQRQCIMVHAWGWVGYNATRSWQVALCATRHVNTAMCTFKTVVTRRACFFVVMPYMVGEATY